MFISATQRNILLIVAAIIFSILALNAYWAFKLKHAFEAGDLLDSSTHNKPPRSSWLVHSNVLPQELLVKKIKNLSEPLEFMVWPQERKVLSKPIQHALHELINQKPYMLDAWRQLSFTEYYLQMPPQERVWTITVGAELSWWETSERLLFVRHCVIDYEVFNALMPSLCKRLIDSLPSNRSTLGLAQDMGVKVKYLQWLLLQNAQ